MTLKTAALLEELGHRVTEIDNPVPHQFKDDFLLYWSFLAFAAVRGGRRMFGPSFDRTKLDNLTLGLDRSAAAICTGSRWRSRGCRGRAGSPRVCRRPMTPC